VPEALARTDHDFVLAAPRAKRRRRQKTPFSRLALLALLRDRPGRVVGFATGGGLAIGILVNALLLQGGPHPAPLFGEKPASTLPAVPALPPARPAELAAGPSPGKAQAPAAIAAPVPSPVPAQRDPIADMLKQGASPAATEPNRTVLAAQRALNKLGYGPIRPDGVFGVSTRQQIERFERDRKLTVTGELGTRTARELAAASGIALD
jgi:hypothetical protein